ncbi:nucleobase:cation symporter-2 family protein [Kiloniella laminariae]|uniref:Nucleobase:cation symporter-2 family protein n=1 Tax=Kiloniella laminariae TaxID=454162 RepID=A0ABT4LGN1_9PROT|nr:nucleobase:cation symporter-2 family protein [Kiloniella laminariae]MCZ4280264.1 nucleobase:cation symporter-2 family protein [Kiloniella laminariae]
MTEISKSAATAEQLKDPNYCPPMKEAIPLGIQHVLAMFAGNVTVPIIIAGVAGLSGGDKVFLIQTAMFVAGIATLLQTIGIGPVGARLPIVQGTSFAFIPIMIPIVKTAGMGALFASAAIGGVFHFILGTFIGRLRGILPPLVTGIVVLSIGLALIPVGIQYAAGGAGKVEDFGALHHISLAILVMVVTLAVKFLTKGFLSASAILIGLIVGYLVAIPMGLVDFGRVGSASWFALPSLFSYGFEINTAAVIGMLLMSVVSAIETVGDISGITTGGAGREATDREIAGGTMADGLGTALGALFGAMPNTSYSQNVGLVALTGVMSRHVVTCGAVFLIIAGLFPKLGAVISVMPNAVLGGAAIIMFGMIAGAGMKLLAMTKLSRRDLVIIAVSLGIGLGLKSVPEAVATLPETAKILMTSGLAPSAFLAILLNLILPKEADL